MTKADFAKLRAGDVVEFNGKRLRTVQQGPADKPRRCTCATTTCGHMYVEFSILRRSWRNRANTVYTWNDLKAKLRPTGKRTRGLLLKSELLTLQALRFDVRKELRREMDEARRLATVGLRPLCRAFNRLESLAQQPPTDPTGSGGAP